MRFRRFPSGRPANLVAGGASRGFSGFLLATQDRFRSEMTLGVPELNPLNPLNPPTATRRGKPKRRPQRLELVDPIDAENVLGVSRDPLNPPTHANWDRYHFAGGRSS
jgi:hypothetical protein